MSILNLTHEQIHHKIFSISALEHEAQRSAVEQIVTHLNSADDWYPESFRRELMKLEVAGTITEHERHGVEHVFFS